MVDDLVVDGVEVDPGHDGVDVRVGAASAIDGRMEFDLEQPGGEQGRPVPEEALSTGAIRAIGRPRSVTVTFSPACVIHCHTDVPQARRHVPGRPTC